MKLSAWNLLFLLFVLTKAENETETTTEKPKHKALSTQVERDRLFEYLFKNYNKHNHADSPSVKYGLALIKVEFDEGHDIMKPFVWLRMVWTDTRLTWNQTKFEVDVLRVPPEMVWMPDIAGYNSVVPDLECSKSLSNALIYPNGEILWVPRCVFTTNCVITLKTDPDKEQICTIKMGSWTIDGDTMDIQFYNNKEFVDLEDYHMNRYNVTTNTAVRNVRHYSCCEEPYIDLTFTLGFTKLAKSGEN